MTARAASLGLCLLTLSAAAIAQAPGTVNSVPPSVTAPNPFDSFTSFSATMTGGLRADQNRKIYRSGNLMRLDFDGSYRVVDLKKHTTWGVGGGHCAEIAAPDAGSYPFSAPYENFKIERVLTDEKETVAGHVCRLSHVTFEAGHGSPIMVKMKLWEAEDLQGFPIKVEVEANGNKVSITYSDVSLEPPDSKLFVHPARCPPPLEAGTAGVADPKSHEAPPKKEAEK